MTQARTTYAPGGQFLRPVAAFAVAALLTSLLVALWSVPSRAATCTTVGHTTTAGILTTSDGETPIPLPVVAPAVDNRSNATATLTADGVTAHVPDALAKVLWLTTLATPVKLADVDGLRLAMRNDVTGPNTASYQLAIDPSPNDSSAGVVHFTTLVWEASHNGYGTISGFKTYTMDPAGPEGWWSTKVLLAVPGSGVGQATFTLKTYLAAYPDAVVKQYGWDLGKGSPGLKTTVSGLRFSTTAACTIHTWALPVVASPTPTPTVTPTSYTGFAVRKQPLIEGRNWDHAHAGWIKPYHSTFEAELVADYNHVAPADTAARTLQVVVLAHRNASHTNGHGAPGQPLVFLPATLG